MKQQSYYPQQMPAAQHALKKQHIWTHALGDTTSKLTITFSLFEIKTANCNIKIVITLFTLHSKDCSKQLVTIVTETRKWYLYTPQGANAVVNPWWLHPSDWLLQILARCCWRHNTGMQMKLQYYIWEVRNWLKLLYQQTFYHFCFSSNQGFFVSRNQENIVCTEYSL